MKILLPVIILYINKKRIKFKYKKLIKKNDKNLKYQKMLHFNSLSKGLYSVVFLADSFITYKVYLFFNF